MSSRCVFIYAIALLGGVIGTICSPAGEGKSMVCHIGGGDVDRVALGGGEGRGSPRRTVSLTN